MVGIVDNAIWAGFFPLSLSNTQTHVHTSHAQGEPFLPVLFVVPILFIATVVLREVLGVRIMSPTARWGCVCGALCVAQGKRNGCPIARRYSQKRTQYRLYNSCVAP